MILKLDFKSVYVKMVVGNLIKKETKCLKKLQLMDLGELVAMLLN